MAAGGCRSVKHAKGIPYRIENRIKTHHYCEFFIYYCIFAGNNNMTREEYERLLRSDYWKGYSYSLIKERNFTCEDCGKHFPNERNKLQVHHLVYRDVNPWSYRPNEVVVLCEECHKKRHGIFNECGQHTQESQDEHEKSSTSTFSTPRSSTPDYLNEWTTFYGNRTRTNSRYQFVTTRKRKLKIRYLLYAVLFVFFLLYVFMKDSEPTTNESEYLYTEEGLENTQSTGSKKKTNKTFRNNPEEDSSKTLSDQLSNNSELDKTNDSDLNPQGKSDVELFSTSDIPEGKKHVEETGQLKHLDVKDGSSLDDIEKNNYKDAINQPEGVKNNTEETTLRIKDSKNNKSKKKKNK